MLGIYIKFLIFPVIHIIFASQNARSMSSVVDFLLNKTHTPVVPLNTIYPGVRLPSHTNKYVSFKTTDLIRQNHHNHRPCDFLLTIMPAIFVEI